MSKISIISKIKGLYAIQGTTLKIPYGIHVVEVQDGQIETIKKAIERKSIKKRVEKGELNFNFNKIDGKKLKEEAVNMQEDEIKEKMFGEKYGHISALTGLDLVTNYEEVMGKKPGNKGEEKMREEMVAFLRKESGLKCL